MKIKFLGTRGYIKIKSRRHNRHTSTMIIANGKRVMIDCGLDWAKKVWTIKPDAIVITHAHPDHAWGLRDGAPCPVYATAESWELMRNFSIALDLRHTMKPYVKKTIGGIIFETFPVAHSIRAPGVGYRICANGHTIFCVHDLVYIEKRAQALRNVELYIGDGATISRPMVRKRDGILFGHTPISTQLTWCKKEKVPQVIITHCGSQIVGNDGRVIAAKIQALAKERGVMARIAYDGLEIDLAK